MLDFTIDAFFALFIDIFYAVFDAFYDIFFNRFGSNAYFLGCRIMASLYSIFGKDVYSFRSIYTIIGYAFIVFVVKQLVHIIRG